MPCSIPDTAPSSLLQLRSWGIRRGSRTVIADMNLDLPEHGVIVLMGPAGTGKSTLLTALSGQRPAYSQQWGQALFQGHPLSEAHTPPTLVQQSLRELNFSVQENLMAGVRQCQSGTQQELQQVIVQRLHTLGLDQLAQHLQHPVIDLPRALARQVAILRAAFTGSPLLLIDEPTSELNETDAEQMLELIRQLGKEHCCFVTLHNQAQARRVADRVLLVAGGHIQADAPVDAFFTNADDHPVLAQFLRTGSCYVPTPDAAAEQLAEGIAAPVPRPLPPNMTAQEAPRAEPPLSTRRGPTGFHWLVPGKLAGCPMPGVVFAVDHDLSLLSGVGITTLINLTERPMPEELLQRYGLKSYHLGIEDRGTPPLMWLKLLLAKMDSMQRNGEVLAVHCLAGLGRTGLVLAAWLIREGLTATEALRRLRLIEPGFVQSQEQEDLLHALENNLLIRASN